MRFSEVLHPEVVLQKRGHPVAISLYQKWLSLVENNGTFSDKPKFALKIDAVKTQFDLDQFQMLRRDNIFLQHVALVKEWILNKEYGQKIYHFSKSLIEDLSQMDKEISIDKLPNRFLGYISFPKGLISDESGPIEGGYISIAPFDETIEVSHFPKLPNEENADRVIWISYICKESAINGQAPKIAGMGGIGGLLVPMVSTRIDNLLVSGTDYSMSAPGSVERPSDQAMSQRAIVYRTLLNCLIYLTCKNAMLEIAKPAKQRGLSNKEILRRGEVINECSIPVTFVGRSYHGVRYSKDQTTVRSYLGFRWMGKGRTHLELTTISGHARKLRLKQEEAHETDRHSD